MASAGVFVGERLELIDGDLIVKMGQNPPHAFVLQGLSVILGRTFGGEYVRVQLPLDVNPRDQDHNFPEPDIAVVRGLPRAYKTKHPQGEEAVLVVEVADSSSIHDLHTKRRLYARAGVPKYWVVDIPRRSIVVHETPAGDEYSSIQTLTENDSVLLTPGGERVPVVSLLP